MPKPIPPRRERAPRRRDSRGAVGGVAVAAQQPRITNGTDRAAAGGLAVGAVVPVARRQPERGRWIGYMVPVVDERAHHVLLRRRQRDVDQRPDRQRRAWLLPRLPPGTRRRRHVDGDEGAGRHSQPTSYARSASDRMVVLFRVVNRAVERIRVFSEDCELDAGGRAITWLEGVRPADSVALLETFATASGRTARSDRRRRDHARSRCTAMPLPTPRSSGCVAASQPEAVRKKVTFWLGNTRGARGLATLRRVLQRRPERRGAEERGLWRLAEPRAGAQDILLGLARNDANPRIRGEALFWLAQKAGNKVAAAITERIEQDPDTEVKKRAVFALSQMPKDEGVPLLINVARTQHEPRRPQAGDVLAWTVEGSAGGRVLR